LVRNQTRHRLRLLRLRSGSTPNWPRRSAPACLCRSGSAGSSATASVPRCPGGRLLRTARPRPAGSRLESSAPCHR
jgi:hypothetical protein